MTSAFSTLLDSAMDCIGYSRANIFLRANVLNKLFEVLSQSCSEPLGAETILTGSKSEGVALLNASDYDVMNVFTRWLCVDIGCRVDDFVIMQALAKDCPPGYTKLRPLNIEFDVHTTFFEFCSIYDITAGILLLSNVNFKRYLTQAADVLQGYQGFKIKCKKQSGPAISHRVQVNFFKGFKSPITTNNDTVLALRYYSSAHLTEWKERKRVFKWPDLDVIQEVSTMEGYVVPVGHTLSEEQNFEWRVCYTTAERKLVSSLSEVHLKVYVLLKMINNDIIVPEVDAVTSYMIKNIVFWTAENSPEYMNTPSYLSHMLNQCLCFLMNCLNNNSLPNYMIPSRNLLLGKITREEKCKLLFLLQELLSEGDRIVLRCEKVRNAMYIMYTDRYLGTRFKLWRDEVEKSFLNIIFKMYSKTNTVMVCKSSYMYDILFEFWKDESFLKEFCKLLNLLSIDIPMILGNGLQGLEEIASWMNNLLS